MSPLDVRGKAIAVAGAGLTGRATARVLLSLGANVCLYDTRAFDALPSDVRADLPGLPCELRAGTNAGLAEHELVVTSPGIAITDPCFDPARAAGVEVISEIEAAYRLWPQARIVAVTGTNGKSTTTALTGEMLRQAGLPVRVCGNIGLPFINEVAEVAANRGAMANTWFVIEVSSFQLEATRFFRARAAALLNVSDDHADRHPTMAEYIAAKARLFVQQASEGTAVLNAGDAACRQVASQAKGQVVWFAASDAPCPACTIRDGRIALIGAGSEEVLCGASRIRLMGRHNLENVLAAAALASAVGAGGDAIGHALDAFEPAPHTFRRVGIVGGVTIINDSKGTNVDATVRGLDGIDAPIVLIAGGSSKGADFEPLGKVLAAKARALVVLGQTADAIADVARRHGLRRIVKVNGMEAAVHYAYGEARPGDFLILSPACASFGLFENYKHRGLVFEEAVARLPGFSPEA